VLAEVEAFLAAEGGNGRLKEERALLGTALGDVRAMVAALVGHVTASAQEPAEVYKAGQHTVRLLMALGDLLCGWLLLRQAEVALTALAGDVPARDQAFYEGKVGAARFFAATVLPLLSAQRAVVENADGSLMELPDAAF
jgi:hypothetical protein